jgi:hypothetical protein
VTSRRPAQAGHPGTPVGGWLYRVAYITTRDQTFSKLFRQQQPAFDFAATILEKDGHPRVDRIRLSTRDWEHLDMWTFEWRSEQ